MSARRALTTALALGLLLGIGGSGSQAALARPDVCPEPNSELPAACFLGAGAAAQGHLDSADDVDTYRIELAPETMIVATLSSLPADLGLRLQLADGSVHAQALEPGRSDKVIRADGLAPGTYFLSVVSPRGESNPEQPYVIDVRFPASILLGTPSAPTIPGGVPPAAYGYVPAPARNYGLRAADAGSGFRELQRSETEDGRGFANLLVAPSSTPFMLNTVVALAPYGSNDEIGAELEKALAEWRKQGLKVEPTVGWGSEQVYSFAAARNREMYRGIALRHRNALAIMEMLGPEQHATWDALSQMMGIVEQRIHAAVQ